MGQWRCLFLRATPEWMRFVKKLRRQTRLIDLLFPNNICKGRIASCFIFVFFYLFGNLAKVADVSQHNILDDRVFGVLPVSLSIEVRMECVHALDCSGSLLLVAENQVDPQVKMGAHVVAFQSLKEKKQEMLKPAEIKVMSERTLHAQSKTHSYYSGNGTISHNVNTRV